MADKTHDLDTAIHYARTRLDKGITHEPRGYFDILKLEYTTLDDQSTAALTTSCHDDVFYNNEEFPVHITHATFSGGFYTYTDDDDDISDPAVVQHIGVNMRFHGHYYMNPVHLPVPVWGNKPVFAYDVASICTSSWKFDEGRYVDGLAGGCFVLSARDTLDVQISLLSRLNNVHSKPARISVTLTGYGIISKRPYVFSSSVNLNQRGQTVSCPTNDFRNDGMEPVLVTDLTVIDQTAYQDSTAATSDWNDIRRVGVNIRQIGNGTNQQWFQGPLDLPPVGQCPASLLGMTSGRAVVHEFPSPIIWEPGQGATITALGFGESLPEEYLCVGLFGYIMLA